MRTKGLRTSKKPPTGTVCGYCFDRMATGYDHLIPISFRVDNRPENLYPACVRCNLLAGNLIFNSIEDKREYVQKKLIQKGQWNGGFVPELSGEVQEGEGVAKVLLKVMPMGKVGEQSSSRSLYRSGRCQRCMKSFPQKYSWQKYCSDRCRTKDWFDRTYVKRDSLTPQSSH